MMKTQTLGALALLVLTAACSKEPSDASKTATAPAAPSPAPAAAPAPAPAAAPKPAAVVGQPAPDFTLADLAGKEVSLASLRGKVVVLEWFNPQCPYVNAAHAKGSLVDAAKRQTEAGVVWLAINSSAPGKQGNEVAANEDAVKRFALAHPILRDENGTVGHTYGATNTPHMFVIDKAGVLVYAGAIDNSPDGEGKSPTDGKLVNHVDAAIADLAAGKPVAVPTTKAYGCSVKYGS